MIIGPDSLVELGCYDIAQFVLFNLVARMGIQFWLEIA